MRLQQSNLIKSLRNSLRYVVQNEHRNLLCYLIHAAQQGNSLEKHDLYQRLLNLEMHFHTDKGFVDLPHISSDEVTVVRNHFQPVRRGGYTWELYWDQIEQISTYSLRLGRRHGQLGWQLEWDRTSGAEDKLIYCHLPSWPPFFMFHCTLSCYTALKAVGGLFPGCCPLTDDSFMMIYYLDRMLLLRMMLKRDL